MPTTSLPYGHPAPSQAAQVEATGILLLVLIAAAALAVWLRRSALRAWAVYAREAGGELKPRSWLAPGRLSGAVSGRPLLMETAISREDAAPYYHTAARMPVANRAAFILALRRKSVLEEAQTRKERPPDWAQEELGRRFFIHCSQPENLTMVVTREAVRELMRYHEVELAIGLDQAEWRRAGEVADLPAIRRLNGTLASMAAAVEALPPREVSLPERLELERVLAQGI